MPSPPTWNEVVPPGTVLLGKYRIDSILGKGGMGIVAEATHLALGEKVAIKMLRPDVIADAEACSRFLREAQASVKLKSEHVARVTDVGTLDGGSPYMVMEFLEGVDLDQMVTASGVVAPPLAVEFVLQGCEALAEAHSLGIIHRDVKPSNFFVTWRPDGTALVKVLDFGISKAPVGVDLALTRTQSVLGTPAYMSPEQMRSARNVDARTDIWSIGTVLYELIEGHRPFEAESFSEMCVKVAADPPLPMQSKEVPPGLEAVIFRCLEKDPARRWQNIGELAAALAPFSRDAHEARVHVDRAKRTLGRTLRRNEDSSPSLPDASKLRHAERTPAPVLAFPSRRNTSPYQPDATPVPAPPPPPIAPGAELPDTEKMPVEPHLVALASELEAAPPPRRLGVIVGVAAGVVIAGVAVLIMMMSGGDAPATTPPAPAAIQQPAPAPTPAPAPVTVPAPAPVTAPVTVTVPPPVSVTVPAPVSVTVSAAASGSSPPSLPASQPPSPHHHHHPKPATDAAFGKRK